MAHDFPAGAESSLRPWAPRHRARGTGDGAHRRGGRRDHRGGDLGGGGSRRCDARADGTFPTLPATSATSAAGFAKLVALTRAKFGTTLVESAALYPDYASVNVTTAANPRHTERWYFAKGYEGEPSKGTIGAAVPLIDIATVDATAMVNAVKRSLSVLGVENVDTTYVILEDWEGEPAMATYVSNEFHETGYWVFSLKGKEIFRYTFE